ncbi:hypothetical protein M0804_011870 [Polistes exclamans]|nr:hypothetical protein M0804_011870 [Polistes exclamans]
MRKNRVRENYHHHMVDFGWSRGTKRSSAPFLIAPCGDPDEENKKRKKGRKKERATTVTDPTLQVDGVFLKTVSVEGIFRVLMNENRVKLPLPALSLSLPVQKIGSICGNRCSQKDIVGYVRDNGLVVHVVRDPS